jgi:acyl-CoA reductase LuxC
MSRGIDARVADVKNLLVAARALYANRAHMAPDIARSTGLSVQGVELGFASLERDATDAELRAVVAGAGNAERVHVILSANVFVAPLRAIAIARAAAEHVSVCPSRRDPWFARALVAEARDDAIALKQDRDVASIDADEIHVYGRSQTIATVRARARAGVTVRGHGAGMGVAMVTRAANVPAAAELIAADVVPFDQRGCLSPRIAIVEGDEARAQSFARALDERLRAWGARVPRGVLFDDERADAVRWRDAMAFAGRVWEGGHHAVGLAPFGAPLAIPPPGRHVHIAAERTLEAAGARLGSIARFVVAVGADNAARVMAFVPSHARVSSLGAMQRPPLDGPVDRRSVF